jgi:ribosomal protein S27AE
MVGGMMEKELALKDRRKRSWIEFEWMDDDLDIEAEDSDERVRVLLDSTQAQKLYEYLKIKFEPQAEAAERKECPRCGRTVLLVFDEHSPVAEEFGRCNYSLHPIVWQVNATEG